MSIYPVHLSSWYPKKTKKAPVMDAKDDKLNSEVAVICVETAKCIACGKKCTWKKAWGHHSIPWGYGDIWCSKRCVGK